MKKRIHVNQHNIRANAKGADLPVLTMKTSKGNIKCNRVDVHGPSTVVYSPYKPLACGAKVWIETDAEVTVHGHAEGDQAEISPCSISDAAMRPNEP